MRRNQGGFTLIELLVVIGLLGVLSSMSMQVFREYQNRAYFAVEESLFIDAVTALEAGKIEVESWGWFTAANINTPGPVTGASAQTLVPGLVLPQDATVYVDYLNCPGTGCLETIITVRHCKADTYINFFRYEDGTEIKSELPNWGC